MPSESEKSVGTRLRQRATVAGKSLWLTGTTQQDIFDAYLQASIAAGVVTQPIPQSKKKEEQKITFGKYLAEFIKTYKTRQCSLTVQNRDQLIKSHIMPKFGKTPIDKISSADIQKWYDDLCDQGYAKASILKLKNIASPAFDSAIEDGLIFTNP